jgi:tetratricopeptide (TPR) repeat protein
MPYLIVIGIIGLIIWGIIKLIIWITPYIATGLAIILGAGAVVGLLVGIFYGIKNYWSAISRNVRNTSIKITMFIVTTISFLALIAMVIYFSMSIVEDIAVTNALDNVTQHKTEALQHIKTGYFDKSIQEFGQAIDAAILLRKYIPKTQKIKEEELEKILVELHELRGRAQIVKISETFTMIGDRNFSEIAVTRPKQINVRVLERAISDFTTAIQLAPEKAILYRERGRAYNWKDEDDKAIQDFNNAIRLNPNYAIVYNSLGILYANKEDDNLAIENYSRAIQVDPNLTYAYRNRAGVYTKKYNYNLAIADLEKAIQIDPNYEQAKQALKQVRQARQRQKQNKRTEKF